MTTGRINQVSLERRPRLINSRQPFNYPIELPHWTGAPRRTRGSAESQIHTVTAAVTSATHTRPFRSMASDSTHATDSKQRLLHRHPHHVACFAIRHTYKCNLSVELPELSELQSPFRISPPASRNPLWETISSPAHETHFSIPTPLLCRDLHDFSPLYVSLTPQIRHTRMDAVSI